MVDRSESADACHWRRETPYLIAYASQRIKAVA
jgi:hypothetical protein